MEIRIKVVEQDGRKVFECDGVRFNDRVNAHAFGNSAGPVYFYRAGETLFQGRVGERKIWPESDRTTIAFIGFTDGRLTELDYLDDFTAGDLELGDEIVITVEKEIDFLRGIIEHFLRFSWNPIKSQLYHRFPYPENWRTDLAAARAVFENKVVAVRAALASGELKFLDFNWMRPVPVKKETTYTIEVVDYCGLKYFRYNGVLFNRLPVIAPFWQATQHRLGGCSIAVYINTSENKLCDIHVGEVSRDPMVMFDAWDTTARLFCPRTQSTLDAKDFCAQNKLVVTSPFEFDLLAELADCLDVKKIPEVADLVALIPDHDEERATFHDADFSFGGDLARAFSLRVRDKIIELVLTEQITLLEFGPND